MTDGAAEISGAIVKGDRRFWTRASGLFVGGLRELSVATERRVPFLDALRVVAVLLVMNGHFAHAFAVRYGDNRFTKAFLSRNGWIGVDLFFVLSGYFIGSQLWRELQKTARISYKRFFIRRGLRIWPLYFFVFVVAFLHAPAAAIAKQYGWTDLVFITNYTNHGIVEGSWSLCSEEQFYLISPLVLLLIGPRSMRAYRWGLAGLLAAVLLARTLTFAVLAGHPLGKNAQAFASIYYPFHTHCDGLIAGLIVANLVASKQRFGGLLARPGLLVILSAVLLIALDVLGDVFEFTGLAIFFAALVWWGVSTGTARLAQHIFYVLSRLSFGMYLNHEYFAPWIATRVEPALGLTHLNAVAAAAAGSLLLIFLSVALSTVTFALVEHPFLVWRDALLRNADPHLTAH